MLRVPAKANSILVDFLDALHGQQEDYNLGKHMVLAVQWKFRHLKGRLTEAWDVLKTWKDQEPVRLRTPMPLELMWAYFITAVILGLVECPSQAGFWLPTAVGILVSFFGLLRPGEWGNLHRN